jgi:hypothetical protein
MSEGLFDHFNGGQRVVLNLQKGHLQFIGTIDQLGERLSSAGEDQALR